MLCAKEDRQDWLNQGRCPDCNGCVDDECRGCNVRFCGGTYSGRIDRAMGWQPVTPCDRCPEKVSKDIVTPAGARTVMVRCNATAGHIGIHHWDPYKAGRKEND